MFFSSLLGDVIKYMRKRRNRIRVNNDDNYHRMKSIKSKSLREYSNKKEIIGTFNNREIISLFYLRNKEGFLQVGMLWGMTPFYSLVSLPYHE
jgi:hypothetical protein